MLWKLSKALQGRSSKGLFVTSAVRALYHSRYGESKETTAPRTCKFLAQLLANCSNTFYNQLRHERL